MFLHGRRRSSAEATRTFTRKIRERDPNLGSEPYFMAIDGTVQQFEF
jgi:hypothetical protein